jgi:hypothetical protein
VTQNRLIAALLLAGVMAVGELLGRGILLTANYERFFTNQLGIGAGLMGIGASDGFVGVVPLYASLALGDIHAFYLSAGTSIFFGDGSIDDDFTSEALATLSFGYQYQSYGGFFVRPLFTFLFNEGDFLLWPGITIGGSF